MSTARSGRPKKDSSRDTRKDLLEAAFELFAQQGFRQVNLTDIAERAGVSIGLIRHYFGSKDGLVDECTRAVMDRLQEVFRRILDGSGPSDGAAFIDYLMQRNIETMSVNVGLLKYLRQLTIENPSAANEAFKEYFQLVQQELNRIEAAGHVLRDRRIVTDDIPALRATVGAMLDGRRSPGSRESTSRRLSSISPRPLFSQSPVPSGISPEP